ncbi:mediator of RNA polymerase II transcription subunit 15-like [Nylanderia fulva]|uniref:mediator of RNA polymerase II transcription subunit 15-like n=1 Tax=Nylanderia fulva TaxID=613905 RepID=UPI0010FB67A0|nr:mediator of RNA polymerase II transcription subunit 15-like [Nylanderia fulva]
MAQTMPGDDSWKTQSFRQSLIAKMMSLNDEAIQMSGMPTPKNSIEIENHLYQKAKSKEEYLGFVARVIGHVREMSNTS